MSAISGTSSMQPRPRALLGDEPDVYCRLAGARDTEQQCGPGLLAVCQGGYAVEGITLALVELGQSLRLHVHFRAAKDFLVPEPYKSGPDKRVQALPRRAREVQQFRYRRPADGADGLQDFSLHWCAKALALSGIHRLFSRDIQLRHCDVLFMYALLAALEPQPGGQHGFDSLVNGAEEALMHPHCQAEQFLAQHRLCVKRRRHWLQLFKAAVGRHRQNYALRTAVCPGERDHDPRSGHNFVLQMLGDAVIIGLIQTERHARDGNFGDFHTRYRLLQDAQKGSGGLAVTAPPLSSVCRYRPRLWPY